MNEIEYWSYTPSELAGHEGASVAKKFCKLFCLEGLEPFAKHCQRFTDKVRLDYLSSSIEDSDYTDCVDSSDEIS